jgi:hypothetical protein
MREGALVLVDCPGFKGIWNRVDPEELIKKLTSIEGEALAAIATKYSESMLSFGPIRFHLRLLSDTVVLSVQYEESAYAKGAEPNESQKNLLVSVACECASALAKLFVDSDIPLPLRGCISFGRHLCENNFLIGPAVDQAAEYMNEPEGAFIWVLPEAVQRHKQFQKRSMELMSHEDETIMGAHAILAEKGVKGAATLLENPEAGSARFVEAMRITYAQFLAIPVVIDPYPLPIKKDGTIDAAGINPLIGGKNEEGYKRIIERYTSFLQGDRIDVQTKRQNTLKFLAVAEEAMAKFASLLGSGDYPE